MSKFLVHMLLTMGHGFITEQQLHSAPNMREAFQRAGLLYSEYDDREMPPMLQALRTFFQTGGYVYHAMLLATEMAITEKVNEQLMELETSKQNNAEQVLRHIGFDYIFECDRTEWRFRDLDDYLRMGEDQTPTTGL